MPSRRLVRPRVLDSGVRLTAAGLLDGALVLERQESGVHRLLAFVVDLLEEGVQVGGARPALASAVVTGRPARPRRSAIAWSWTPSSSSTCPGGAAGLFGSEPGLFMKAGRVAEG